MISLCFRSGEKNRYSFIKNASDKVLFAIDYSDLLTGSDSLSSGTAIAYSSAGTIITTQCVGTLVVSGNRLLVSGLTFGTSGTSPAADGTRVEIIVTGTTASGAVGAFETYWLVAAPAYAPIPT